VALRASACKWGASAALISGLLCAAGSNGLAIRTANLQLFFGHENKLVSILAELNHCGFDQVVVTHWANCHCRQNIFGIFRLVSYRIEDTLEADGDSICTIAATSDLMLGFEEGFNRNCDD
jgi:hypothetical protein